MNKAEFIRETSVKLLTAYLIEDRIAWYKDEYYCCDYNTLVTKSVEMAELLWQKIEEKGYVESEQENVESEQENKYPTRRRY